MRLAFAFLLAGCGDAPTPPVCVVKPDTVPVVQKVGVVLGKVLLTRKYGSS